MVYERIKSSAAIVHVRSIRILANITLRVEYPTSL